MEGCGVGAAAGGEGHKNHTKLPAKMLSPRKLGSLGDGGGRGVGASAGAACSGTWGCHGAGVCRSSHIRARSSTLGQVIHIRARSSTLGLGPGHPHPTNLTEEYIQTVAGPWTPRGPWRGEMPWTPRGPRGGRRAAVVAGPEKFYPRKGRGRRRRLQSSFLRGHQCRNAQMKLEAVST